VEQFDEVLARWVAAEARCDAAALDALLDAEFRGDGPGGFVLTKDEWLDRCRDGMPVTTGFSWRTTSVRTAGAAVVATGEAEDAAGRFLATVVAVQRGTRWAIANLQLDRLSPVEGPREAAG
jgi:Domain of unknown function (DUF4440)